MKKISILGAGWLGTPLALHFKELGHQIKVSTTKLNKLHDFQKQGLQAFLIDTDQEEQTDDWELFFKDTDLLIITIPPAHNQVLKTNYSEKIRKIIPNIEKHKIKEVIFTSSTTVYISLSGLVDEKTEVFPVSEMDKQILEVENLLLKNPYFQSAILRLGGLIGEDRHPVHYIVKKSVVNDANNPVNMVHRKDIIRFLSKMVTKVLPNDVFNIVAPIHHNRRDFYTQEAKKLGLSPLPHFIDNPSADFRKVNGEKITKFSELNYRYLID